MKIRLGVTIATSLCLVLLGEPEMLSFPTGELKIGSREWRQGERGRISLNSPFLSPDSQSRGYSYLKQASKDGEINPKLIAANTKFSFQLFSQIIKNSGNENIFISPASIAIALAMTYNGANGQTQQAIAKTLEIQGISIEELNLANAALKVTLTNGDPQVQLSIANSIWAKNGEPFKPEFARIIHQFYGAEIKNINFSDATATSIINNWVKESTNGKINTIVDRLEPDTIFVLLNTIYFLGAWTQPFSEENTQERPFTLLNGTQKMHAMMFQSVSRTKYYENELFQAIALPYGRKKFSMYIFLPKPNITLENFYQNLTSENWDIWMKELTKSTFSDEEPEPVFIGLPRLKLEYEINLNNTLERLGMQIAFKNGADFSGMTNTPVWISQVQHKTFVEVNERGTEAAAVTKVGFTRGMAIRMIVDRPFFCVIRDEETGTILFMGSIIEPN